MSTPTSKDESQVKGQKLPSPPFEALKNWKKTFYLYSYCYSCPSGVNGCHKAEGCRCGCHVIAMFKWIEGHAKEYSLEDIVKFITKAEDEMEVAQIPIRAIDELRKIRERAMETAAVKPL